MNVEEPQPHSYVIRVFLEADTDPVETRESFLNLHGVNAVSYKSRNPHSCEVSYYGPSQDFDKAINNIVGVEETVRIRPERILPTV